MASSLTPRHWSRKSPPLNITFLPISSPRMQPWLDFMLLHALHLHPACTPHVHGSRVLRGGENHLAPLAPLFLFLLPPVPGTSACPHTPCAASPRPRDQIPLGLATLVHPPLARLVPIRSRTPWQQFHAIPGLAWARRLMSQFFMTSTFMGFRSRCTTLAECRYLRAYGFK